VSQDGNTPANPEGHLICYKVAVSGSSGATPVAVVDELGSGTFNARRAETLCVPGYVLLPQ
jgi:hypothetical protein